MTEQTHTNALINETSPYLLQHAHNPVEWYPWGDEALDKARLENKPILLSIGYSACHWCHVMAHESFEDADTARVMNEYFINIKVDREERPDIDKIYQTAQQMLTRRPGGWPLTMFLTPDDHIPFFGGTYFPPANRYGMPGFTEVLQRVAEYFHHEKDAIRQQNESLKDALHRLQAHQELDNSVTPDTGPLATSVQELVNSFDKVHGGFGGAPKFPTPTNITRLLHHQEMFPDERRCLDMALHTLRMMARGGIYDHLGGGFCRYSVDSRWLIPHFEKMLYDNGPLLALYTTAWHLSKDPLFADTAVETAEWMMREMQSPGGGFYSSLDADSEGEEGRFYVWTPRELEEILDLEEYRLTTAYFGLDGEPNFEGKWHFHVQQPLDRVAAEKGMDEGHAVQIINRARRKLYEARSARIHPGRDEKILTSWNALAIRGMSIAGIHLEREDFLDSAERALEFIQQYLWRDGRLLATCKDGRAHLNAYLDDYSFLLDAILHLISARWNTDRLRFAMQLAECLLDLFHDSDNGGFYFTSHDHEQLIQRRKDFMDDALPSGNGIAAIGLLRLGHLINKPGYINAAANCIRSAWPMLQQMPSAHNAMLFALEDEYSPPLQIILRGRKEVIKDWNREIYRYAPVRCLIYAIPRGESGLPDILQQRNADAEAAAFVCSGFSCLEPFLKLDDLVAYLKSTITR